MEETVLRETKHREFVCCELAVANTDYVADPVAAIGDHVDVQPAGPTVPRDHSIPNSVPAIRDDIHVHTTGEDSATREAAAEAPTAEAAEAPAVLGDHGIADPVAAVTDHVLVKPTEALWEARAVLGNHGVARTVSTVEDHVAVNLC